MILTKTVIQKTHENSEHNAKSFTLAINSLKQSINLTCWLLSYSIKDLIALSFLNMFNNLVIYARIVVTGLFIRSSIC